MEREPPNDGAVVTIDTNDESKSNEIDVRVAVIGNVDSGKSTLVGVLTRCIYDDGRGSARSLVFNFSHEHSNGRTSSISHEIMGFNPDGSQVTPDRVTESKKNTWESVVPRSNHIVTFLDLCGHEKYLKTTIFGLVGLIPDYAMIVIGANMGITRMSKEHIGLSLALKIPMFFVFTKIDIAPENVYKENFNLLKRILSSSAANRVPLPVENNSDIQKLVSMMESKGCPIFSVSNVTGEGLDQLRLFISCLKTRSLNSGVFGTPNQPAEVLIDSVFMVTGVGVVVSGVLKAGVVKIGDVLQLGPDSNDNYKPVSVKGIQILRVNQDRAIAGQSASFAIRAQNKKEQLKRDAIKRNGPHRKSICAETSWEFDAEVVILHHATTIKKNTSRLFIRG